LPEPVDLVVADASFISLQTLFPAFVRMARPGGDVIPLIKPQFEAGRSRVGKGGVVRDPEIHREVLTAFIRWVSDSGFSVVDLVASPVKGPAGNVEFLAHIRLAPDQGGAVDERIERAIAESREAA
jgi:23S rRNA (cytidine1920-2'-O)/16S rRNA (cytidine1409-2'-O)-methyltransferase